MYNIDLRLVALWEGGMESYRDKCSHVGSHAHPRPTNQYLRVGSSSLGDSYVQPALAPMVYSTLTPQDNIKTKLKQKLNITSTGDIC